MDSDSNNMTPTGRKYSASRADIVNDLYDECQRLSAKYRYQREAILAIDEFEGLVVWWMNAPAVARPEYSEDAR